MTPDTTEATTPTTKSQLPVSSSQPNTAVTATGSGTSPDSGERAHLGSEAMVVVPMTLSAETERDAAERIRAEAFTRPEYVLRLRGADVPQLSDVINISSPFVRFGPVSSVFEFYYLFIHNEEGARLSLILNSQSGSVEVWGTDRSSEDWVSLNLCYSTDFTVGGFSTLC